ncbi:hypothetical protein CROQUDRAFT_716286 [Cronartium quercuum f. sp. fusiforme G11]|uniref:Uncharacterized protein n=1 Tax=Cronartium quercuum f. sp. fusiforme G11 TaxID=708437 RepID=A0A9P6NJ38_9BASI|nr:hypothetical protein CROQUDRAFT_716286 [Cronartium quercuum f. sp. fusiforme G11]
MVLSASPTSPRVQSRPLVQSKTSSVATNTLIITSLPPAFFHPAFQVSLRAHFASYGPLAAWISLAGLGRILAVYHASSNSEDGRVSAARARREMDRFVIEAGGGDTQLADERSSFRGPAHEVEADTAVEKELDELIKYLPRTVFRIYYGPPTPTLSSAPTTIYPNPDGSQDDSIADERRLKPPASDKNFLISPPGSPPVGWEQVEEDAPNKATLAEDLCQRLRFLSVGDEGEEGGENEDGVDGEEQDIEIIKPSPSSVLPGLRVQQSGPRGDRPGMDIGLVKATIDSMLGSKPAERITPTARPALR